VPVLDVTPVDGKLRYDEGIHIGYRAWLRSGVEPAYPFGFGLGYTTWRLSDLTAGPDEVTLSVTNQGQRAGKQVVQVYLSRSESTVDRPVRWLAGHAAVRAQPGETVTVTIPVPRRAFADWQPDGWHYEPGEFTVLAGTSATDLPLAGTITSD
jgi:beta-glucosidase